MAYGFCLDKEERKIIKKENYNFSIFKKNFDSNYGNVLALLMIAGKTHNIDFTEEEIQYYGTFVDMLKFYNPKDKNQWMKENIEQTLREQAIVTSVSNWECYFSDISEDILRDYILEKIYKNKDKLKKFLTKFNLKRDFSEEMLLNGYRIKGLEFANFIKKNKKINYQDKDDLKDFLDILYDIDIVKIDEYNWTEIVEFIEDRHKIIHDKNKQNQYGKIMEKYNKEKIKSIILNMKKIIDEIDEILFTDYHKLIQVEL